MRNYTPGNRLGRQWKAYTRIIADFPSDEKGMTSHLIICLFELVRVYQGLPPPQQKQQRRFALQRKHCLCAEPVWEESMAGAQSPADTAHSSMGSSDAEQASSAASSMSQPTSRRGGFMVSHPCGEMKISLEPNQDSRLCSNLKERRLLWCPTGHDALAGLRWLHEEWGASHS